LSLAVVAVVLELQAQIPLVVAVEQVAIVTL
jgi:hypothetical protein